ncbi:arabinosyltransferase domain-containing protein [Crossiella sp. SN42]|uniref:arabinosyltransferase domain-containing protein n=1 Tax=Crossiella sp. SN42 TaxID=2944808 RepID=UPI00207D6474|nr:arabinosyltransferase domain-containing protein [Crossiella sp. SN42]MCO1581527.1 arabinosyltransferase domain-containing protein [Crossiella sp. SN42]
MNTRAVLALALSTVLCGLALPFAPVVVNDPVLSWPKEPDRPESSLALLVPYRPLSLDVRLPCATLRQPKPDTVVFASHRPDDAHGAARGLTVLAGAGSVRISSDGLALHQGAAPAGDCVLRIRAGTGETVVELDGDRLAAAHRDPPQLSAFATTLTPAAARGMTAVAHTDARFESSPALLKTLLLGTQVLLLGGCLFLLWRNDSRRRRRWLPRRPGWLDGVMLAVLGGWAVAGPMTDDDGFYAAMARAAADTGYVGNYYHWFNVTEAPFSLLQQLLTPWVLISQAPLWLRLPSLLACFGTWLVLSRGVLPRLTGAQPRILTAAVLLCWLLPFGIGVRPEPWVALGSASVLALVLRGLAHGRVFPLGVAAALAGLCAAITPSGLIAFTPFLGLARPLSRLLRAKRGALLVLACASTGLTAVFADTSLGAVLEATRVHSEIGPALHWYEEIVRYFFLLDEGSMGSFARRLPVLLALGLLLLLPVLRLRIRNRGEGLPPLTAAVGPAIALAAGIGLLWLAPSKWTHHFGSLTALATLVTALVLAELPAALRLAGYTWRGGLALTAASAVLVALALAGPNTWYGYSQFGVDPKLPSILANPLLWLAIGLGLAWLWRDLLPAPRLVLVLGLATSLLLTIGTVALSTWRLRDSWSMAGENVRHVIGRSCGMADEVSTLAYQRLVPQGTAPSPGGAPNPPPEDQPVWGTFGRLGGPGHEWFTGEVITPWFALPALGPGQDISVQLAGKLTGGNNASVHFGHQGQVLAEQTLTDVLDSPDWRESGLNPPPGATQVRVRLRDGSVGAGGWLAGTAPRLRSAHPLLALLGQDRPVMIDWQLSLAFPCLRAAKISHGLTEAPEYVLVPRIRDRCKRYGAACLPFGVPGIAREEPQGGSFLPAHQAAAARPELPTRFAGLPERSRRMGDDWGALIRYEYPFGGDGYRLELRERSMGGWEWGWRQPIVPSVEKQREEHANR